MTARRALAAAGVLLLALLTSACGNGDRPPSAAEQVPALGERLERIDGALAAHDFLAARRLLRQLRADVVAARRSDELGDADAGQVLDAVARLLALLPAPKTEPTTAEPSASEPADEQRPERDPTTARPSRSASPTPTPTPGETASPSPTPPPESTPASGPTPSALASPTS